MNKILKCGTATRIKPDNDVKTPTDMSDESLLAFVNQRFNEIHDSNITDFIDLDFSMNDALKIMFIRWLLVENYYGVQANKFRVYSAFPASYLRGYIESQLNHNYNRLNAWQYISPNEIYALILASGLGLSFHGKESDVKVEYKGWRPNLSKPNKFGWHFDKGVEHDDLPDLSLLEQLPENICFTSFEQKKNFYKGIRSISNAVAGNTACTQNIGIYQAPFKSGYVYDYHFRQARALLPDEAETIKAQRKAVSDFVIANANRVLMFEGMIPAQNAWHDNNGKGYMLSADIEVDMMPQQEILRLFELSVQQFEQNKKLIALFLK